MEELGLVFGTDRINAVWAEDFQGGESLGFGADPSGGGIEFGSDHENSERETDGLFERHFAGDRISVTFLEAEDAANGAGAGAGSGVIDRLKLRAERIVEIDLSFGGGSGLIEPCEEGHDDTDALHGHGKIIPEQAGESADFGWEAEVLELAAPVVLEGRLEHSRHLEGGGGDTSNGQERGGIDFDDFIDGISDDDISGGGAAVTGHEDAFGVMESEDGGSLDLHRGAGGNFRF